MDFERPFQFRKLQRARQNLPTAFCVPLADGGGPGVGVRIKISLFQVVVASLYSLPISFAGVMAALKYTGIYQGSMTFGDSGPLGFAITMALMLVLPWGFILFLFASERKVLVRFLEDILGA